MDIEIVSTTLGDTALAEEEGIEKKFVYMGFYSEPSSSDTMSVDFIDCTAVAAVNKAGAGMLAHCLPYYPAGRQAMNRPKELIELFVSQLGGEIELAVIGEQFKKISALARHAKKLGIPLEKRILETVGAKAAILYPTKRLLRMFVPYEESGC